MSNGNPKLQRTKQYSQFKLSKENREVDILNLKPQHKKLRESMGKYGFLPSFPLMVRADNGRFIVLDGQHRLTFAKEFGLEVFYVCVESDVSISEINQAQVGWNARDFANRWANDGHRDYRAALDFATKYNIPVGQTFSMLAGTIVFQNIVDRFHEGKFRITNEAVARRVASCYQEITRIRKGMKHANLLSAIWACCHVDYFDESRVVETAQRRPEMLITSGTRESFLQMLEEIYNFARRTRAPLKFDAEEAMRERNPKIPGGRTQRPGSNP